MPDLLEILRQRNVPYRQAGDHHHVSQGWVGVDCPFCGKGTGVFHMGFHLAKRFSSCWRCGYHPAWKTLAELLGIRYTEARDLLGADPEWEQEDRRKHRRGELALPNGLGPLLPSHLRYLEKRGFDPEELERLWGIQGIGFAGRLAWRIWIPFQLHGTVVSWTTRSLRDEGQRYIAATAGQEVLSAKTLLFGEDYARHAVIVCYSNDTEVLTDTGWVPFPALEKHHMVAQYTNPETKDGTGRIDFVNPTAIQSFQYEGEIVHYRAEWCDLLVTPDHRMLTRRQRCYPRVIRANEFTACMTIPVAGILPSSSHKNTPSPNPARLLVAYAADAHWEERGFKVIWGLHKKRKQRRFRKILNALKIPFSERTIPSSPGKMGITFTVNKTDIPFVHLFGPEKTWPWSAMNWGLRARRSVLNEIPRWDGDGRRHGKSSRFFTSKKQDAEVVSAIAALTGWGSAIRRKKSRRKGHSDEWIVQLNPRSWRSFFKGLPPNQKYNGTVHCCTVPSGFIVVRRNGKVAVSGNCEGPFDVFRIGPGAVATMGTAYTGQQLERISKYPIRAVCFDRETQAQKRARKLCTALEPLPGATYNVVLRTKDPGSADAEEVKELRKRFLE